MKRRGEDFGASSASSKPKQSRTGSHSSCEECRKRKGRCSGGQPCEYCARHAVSCQYHVNEKTIKWHGASRGLSPGAAPMAAARAKAEPGVEQSQALVHSLMRHYYLDLYHHRIDPVFQLFAEARPPYDPSSGGELLEQNVAALLSARALGHMEIASQLLLQARSIADGLEGAVGSSTASGLAMLVAYFLSECSPEAAVYANKAVRVITATAPCRKSAAVEKFMSTSRLPLPASSQGRSQVVAQDAQSSPKTGIALLWSSPAHVLTMDIARRFPVDCVLVDVLCQTRPVRRLPPEERTNELLSPEATYAAFQVLSDAWHELLEVPVEDPSLTASNFFLILQAGAVFVCAATGLRDLGCAIAVHLLDCVQTIPSSHLGFSYAQFAIPVMMIGAFSAMYHINPRNRLESDHRVFLLELMDVLRPVAERFATVRQILQAFDHLCATPGVALLPSPVEHLLVADLWVTHGPLLSFLTKMPAPAPVVPPELLDLGALLESELSGIEIAGFSMEDGLQISCGAVDTLSLQTGVE